MKRTMTDRIRIGEAAELVLSADNGMLDLKAGNAPPDQFSGIL
jgi:hypothetical protein